MIFWRGPRPTPRGLDSIHGTPPRSSPLLAKEALEQRPHLRELGVVVEKQLLGRLPTLILARSLSSLSTS
jgi:hypothetical protein